MNLKLLTTITAILLLLQSCSGADILSNISELFLEDKVIPPKVILEPPTIKELNDIILSGKHKRCSRFFRRYPEERQKIYYDFQDGKSPLEDAFENGNELLVNAWLMKTSDKLVAKLVKKFPRFRLLGLYEMIKDSESRFKLIHHEKYLDLLLPEAFSDDDLGILKTSLDKKILNIGSIVNQLREGYNNGCHALLVDKLLEYSNQTRSEAFISAVKLMDWGTMYVLIKYGGNVNVYDERGISLIMLLASINGPDNEEASYQNYLCIVAQNLIDYGADLDVVGTEDNLLPYEMAEKAENFRLAEYLRNQTPFPQI